MGTVKGNRQKCTDTLNISSSTCKKRKGIDVDMEFVKELKPLRESSSEFNDGKYFLFSLLPLM